VQIVVCKPLNTIKGYRPLPGKIDTKSTQKSNESPDCSGMLMRHFADSTAGHTPSVITNQWKNADALDCKILQCTEKLILRLLTGRTAGQMYQFALKAAEEILRHRIVVGLALPEHALHKAQFFELTSRMAPSLNAAS